MTTSTDLASLGFTTITPLVIECFRGYRITKVAVNPTFMYQRNMFIGITPS